MAVRAEPTWHSEDTEVAPEEERDAERETKNCVDCGERLSNEVAAIGLARCTPCSAKLLRSSTAEAAEEMRPDIEPPKFCTQCGNWVARHHNRCRVCSHVFAGSEDNLTAEERDAVQKTTRAVANDLAIYETADTAVHRLIRTGWEEQPALTFVASVQESVPRSVEIDIGRGGWDFIIGIGVLVIAGGISYGTYASAEAGGTYWIWWGPMVYGGYRIIRGFVRAFVG